MAGAPVLPRAQIAPRIPGGELQVRISELPPAADANPTDQFEVNQGGVSRRLTADQLLELVPEIDFTPFLRGVVGGSGIVVAGGAPIPTVSLAVVAEISGTYGDATHVAQITVDQHGRIAAVTLVPVALPDLSGYAPLNSPQFTGQPRAPTPPPETNDTRLVTAAFVHQVLSEGLPDLTAFARLDSPAFIGTPTAPAPAAGDSSTRIPTTGWVQATLASIDVSALAPLNSPIFTGTPRAPTPDLAANDDTLPTTGWVQAALAALDILSLAPLDSPAFSGTPTAPTPATTDNDDSIATAAFVKAAIAAALAEGGGGDWETGDVRLTYRQTPSAGWLFLDDTTIGNPASGAVHTGDEYWPLYEVLWPIPDVVVAGGKGTDAASDWAANKTLTLAAVLGRVLGIAGAGAGLTARALGKTEGVEVGGGQTGSASSAQGIGPPGGGWVFTDPHSHGFSLNVMQPTAFLNAEIRL